VTRAVVQRTAREETLMERKRTLVDLQQLDLLEQKIVKATELIRSLRRERDAALASLEKSQEALAQAQTRSAASEKERREMEEITEHLEILKDERLEIRGKVTRMIEMMSHLDEMPVESRKDH
jgi:hypothetical protein